MKAVLTLVGVFLPRLMFSFCFAVVARQSANSLSDSPLASASFWASESALQRSAEVVMGDGGVVVGGEEVMRDEGWDVEEEVCLL